MDLVKLFLNVKKKGGFNRVTENGLWDFVAKECDFFDASDDNGLSLKLFYVENLEKIFESVKKERSVVSDTRGGCSMDDLSMDSEPFLSEVSGIKTKNDVNYAKLDVDKLLEFLNEECDASPSGCSMDTRSDWEPFLSEVSDTTKKKDVNYVKADKGEFDIEMLLQFLNEDTDNSRIEHVSNDDVIDLVPNVAASFGGCSMDLSSYSDAMKKNDVKADKGEFDLETLLEFLNEDTDNSRIEHVSNDVIDLVPNVAASSGGCSMDLSSDSDPFLSQVSDIKNEHNDATYVKKVDWDVPKIHHCYDDTENHHHRTKGVLRNNVKEECLASVEFKPIDKGSDSIRCLKKKRKRGEFESSAIGILDWIHKVARDPCDPGIGSLPECAEWKDYAADVVWKQVLMIHEAMLSRPNDCSNGRRFAMQKRQKMHPTMYNEPEKFRHSQRIHSAKADPERMHSRTISKSSSPKRGDNNDENPEFPDHPRKPRSRTVSKSSSPKRDSIDENPEFPDHPRKPRSRTVSKPSSPKRDNNDENPEFLDYLSNKHHQIRVNIGQKYQADVPEWTTEKKKSSYEVDSKWFGTPVWPLGRMSEQPNKNRLIEREPLGKGRSDSCGCQFPGSTECVRFHVSEKSKRLKLELGIAFYLWRFNRMGEGTSVTWTKEEENKFLDTWKSSPKPLPNKSRALLVNYYFNVYLLRRRGEQNRISPNNITSDDEDEDEDEDTASERVEPTTVSSTKNTVKTRIK